MEWQFIWKAFVMILSGFILLRLSGRKSIAQMTVTTTIVMISIGTIIVQPIIETSVLKTFITIIIFILVLMFFEYIQVKSSRIEKIITGEAIPVIQEGTLLTNNLKKVRMTVDKLEMQLRQQGISNMKDIKNATIEANGRIGYELMPDAKPLTVGEFKKLMGMTFTTPSSLTNQSGDLFYEVNEKKHRTPNDPKLD
ncbi:hypothetical protein Pryu01_02869 [Paraliobacillus ryukyuensis]|uniref:Uncharacterized membrane protein YcaP (DUF421 family) n=1 Tax=Paraliobacillus ryukyuensis TaxID=200904 RepID=A0A366DZ47_9BACI|nr:DUF421 domain-containing protein [Paraliobacillus ryukyuensis]RBO95376.1 uncharacterized membrane protein YcaP (DUF421 family) [Paraliobacillus ryukyuensis]